MGKSRRSIIERPTKPLPACAAYLNKFEGERIYYPSEKGKYGVFVFHKGPGVGLALFTEKDDGTIRWHPRVVPSKKTGKPIFIYDLVEVHMVIADEVANAILRVAGKEFGTPKAVYQKVMASAEAEGEDAEIERLMKKHGHH